jgi:ribonuclease HII
MNLFAYDGNYYEKGFNFIAGIDEAGRGPLAGPVSAAAVIFPKDVFIDGLNDSKKLTPNKRTALSEIIKNKALSFAIAMSDNEIIDEINILQATFLAMRKAIKKLKIQPDLCLIDGNRPIPNLELKQETIVKGDSKSAAIAAASILAKTFRDEIMIKFSEQFPQYGFDKHKGYGVKSHAEKLEKFGICAIHRKTFAPIKHMLEGK